MIESAKEITHSGKGSVQSATTGSAPAGLEQAAAVRHSLKVIQGERAMTKTEESGNPDVGVGLPDLELVARTELGETPEVKERSLALLRQLIAGDKSLDCPADDAFLVKYLRCRKYRVEETFEVIRNYFRVRKRLPDVFINLSPHNIPYHKIIVQNRLIQIAKQRDPQGRAVAMMKLGAWNTGICSITDLLRAALVMAEWTLENEETQIRGVVGVFDLKGFNISHLAHFTPFFIKKLAHIVEDCYPSRLKAVHVLNNPYFYELLYAMIKPFMKSKLAQRFHFTGRDLSKLHGILPPECIPAEFGGTNEEFDYCSQERDVKSTEDYYQRVSRWGYHTE